MATLSRCRVRGRTHWTTQLRCCKLAPLFDTRHRLRAGDPVIFRMGKCSTRPGPRARSVSPAPHGDSYSYVVDKLWLVEQVRDDGRVALITRRGKKHVVRADDPRLRKPHWWERILFRNRFPDPELAH